MRCRRSARRSSFTKGRIIVRGKLVTRGKAKRADYILYYKPNIPHRADRGQGQQPQRRRRHAAGPRLRRRRSTSPSSSPRTATASCSTTAPARAPQTETNLALDAFPSPADLWARYRAWKGLTPEAEADRPSGLLRRRQRQGAALLPGQRRQRRHRGHRQGPGPHPARHGDRHRQDLHRLPDHLAAVEGRPQETHPLPRRPQRAHRPDDGERLPALRRGDGEAQHRRQDHRARGRHRSRTDHRPRQEAPHRHRPTRSTSASIRRSPARRNGRSCSASSRPASST